MEIVCDWCVKVMNYWDQIRNYIQQKVSTESYDNWLKGTGFTAQHGDILLVSVPDQETQAWLETEFSSLVRTAIDAAEAAGQQDCLRSAAGKGCSQSGAGGGGVVGRPG